MGALGLWKPGLARQDPWGGAGPSPGLELCSEQRLARPGGAGGGLVGRMGASTLRTPAPTLLFSPHPWTLGQTYDGQVLKKSADLQTNACVTAARPVPKHIQEALQNVNEEVSLR